MVDVVKQIIDQANAILWNWPERTPLMVVALLGAGIFLTLRLRFINVRGFRHALRVVRGVYTDPKETGDISHFQALSTALSATVGIGNIAGVATAIHYGGPGALFWMWITAIFGMTTKYTECTLALHYRKINPDGSVSGGPMYYIERGFRSAWFKPLALFFAVATVISSFGSGNSVQAFSMADSFRDQFHLPTWITGAFAASIIAAVIIGGIKRIAHVTSRVVPLMAVLYFFGAVVILLLNVGDVPVAFATILSSAFEPHAALGGFAGSTFVLMMTWGVKRGIFSNEAGQGSAPIAHAAARTEEPVREGSVALLEPSIDTLLICTLTGLVIVTTGVWYDKKQDAFPINLQSDITLVAPACVLEKDAVHGANCTLPGGATFPVREGKLLGAALILNHSRVDDAQIERRGAPFSGTAQADAQGRLTLVDEAGAAVTDGRLLGRMAQNNAPLTAWAFQQGLQPIVPWGAYLVTICVFLFAISTAIGWSYYGDRAVQYLFGNRAVFPYRVVFCLVHFIGAIIPLEMVWAFGDAALAAMTLPNLIAIVLLSPQVVRLTNAYFAREHRPLAPR